MKYSVALFVVAMVIVAGMSLSPRLASAQAALVTGLGGPLDFGTDALARDDDELSSMVDLTPAFPTGIDFFGTRYTELFINTNGNFSFGAAVETYTPEEFPSASQPIIAAWWADVDTRGLITDEPDRNLVYYALTPGRLVATWIDVGYFDSHVDLLNAFQIILTAAPGEPDGTFDVELRYNRCEWTTGDDTPGHMMGLGGIAAQAGFDAGDMVNYLTLPGSRTDAVRALCLASNVDMTGVWQLHPRGRAVAAVCGNGLRETGEECDDGGRAPRDGCDADCRVDTPCYDIFADGAIWLPFDAEAFLRRDGSFVETDANGDDAAGGLVFEDAGEIILSEGGVGPGPGLRRCMGADEDAGPALDAGSIGFPDAGRFDGGPPPMDAAVPNVLTVTGSGCSCRIGAGDGPSHASWSFSAALAALLTIRRIRGRARARAGTSRRPSRRGAA